MKQWGRSSWETCVSQCRSPRVISQGWPTLRNYMRVPTGILYQSAFEHADRWKSQHSARMLPPVLGPDGRIKTLNVSFCCTCTTSTAIAWRYLGCFLEEAQDEAVRLTSPSPPTLPAGFLSRKTMWLPQIWLTYALQTSSPQLFKYTIKFIPFQI